MMIVSSVWMLGFLCCSVTDSRGFAVNANFEFVIENSFFWAFSADRLTIDTLDIVVSKFVTQPEYCTVSFVTT